MSKFRRDDRGHQYESESRSNNDRERRHRRDEGRMEGTSRDYDERRRERERERDRQRYDSGRERYDDRSAARRSASPRTRDSRPRERGSHSASPSVQSPDKAKPDFKPSGLLAAETNTVKAADGTTTVLKYNEPPEARKPVQGWRLYVFKDSEQVGEHCEMHFCWILL